MSVSSTAKFRFVREHRQSFAGENEVQRQSGAEEMALQVCNFILTN
jgi:hypothetical protein